jgi:hypothetical protein
MLVRYQYLVVLVLKYNTTVVAEQTLVKLTQWVTVLLLLVQVN